MTSEQARDREEDLREVAREDAKDQEDFETVCAEAHAEMTGGFELGNLDDGSTLPQKRSRKSTIESASSFGFLTAEGRGYWD